ncbi:hypothetical protein [Halomonas sp.]|uniref:hypothetical protein n=1 Tax=Halomonas sp. TaxID=1486246 RepID=UPI003F9038B3
MKTWQLGKTQININPDSACEKAYVEPATQAQIEALGKVVIGEAWMTSQPYSKGPIVIKFAPPQADLPSNKTEQSALWERCYRKIIIISEREELTSLSLPLPGENPHVAGRRDAFEQAILGLCTQLKQARWLQRLDIYATDESQAFEAIKKSRRMQTLSATPSLDG